MSHPRFRTLLRTASAALSVTGGLLTSPAASADAAPAAAEATADGSKVILYSCNGGTSEAWTRR
ncbi:hypothetical protein SRB17_66270 [Streptomyces sp. RB17]|uniref:hypothetical protein n=1 Tax=Streptomyces sp. RB17 TaxID=2585197 RepID=UPI001295B125|nr:hypothetical protein [Streptomyces sp. RB17]MQY38614.1 hypothetical protein [Streptomyces sp. RB17]